MKKLLHYYQLIPEKLLRDLSFIEDKLRPQIKGYCTDNLKQVISIVACHTRKNTLSSQLQMVYIKNMVAQGDKYLKGLLDLNVIVRSGNAIKGQCSFKYSFSSDYQSKFVSLPLHNPKLVLRIEKAQTVVRKGAGKLLRNHCEQVRFLRQLSIDPGCLDFINSNYSLDSERYNSAMSSAIRIMDKDYFYSVDSTSGRFHSNITNMPKGLRPFLRIRGEPLVNIDIKNSQPFLTTLLLTNPGKVSFLTKNPDFSLLLQTLKVPRKEDVTRYISLVNSGQLYEYLMAEFAKEGLELTRDEAKCQVLRILFARNRMPKDGPNRKARQIFKDRFPSVHRIFSKIRGSSRGDKFSCFKRFAILLQSIESHLMLNVIMKRIAKELPGQVAMTIHDSILTGCSSAEVEAVRRIMTEELTLFVGFEPQIKVEGEIIRGEK